MASDLQLINEAGATAVTVDQIPPTGNELIEMVATLIEQRGHESALGTEGIQYRHEVEMSAQGYEDIEWMDEATALDLRVEGTVYDWIAESLETLGVPGQLDTIGEVMAGLGIHGGEDGHPGWDTDDTIPTNAKARHRAAHDIGCHCNGTFVTASEAAERVRAQTI